MIGSGFGGLAAAVRLGARGYRVTVLEKNTEPGGRAAVVREQGFSIDAGPTILTLPFLFEELWALCWRRLADDVTLKALDPFYRLLFHDGSSFACSGDEAAMRAQVRALAPGDEAGLEPFLAESARNYAFAFERLGLMPFHKLTTFASALPGFVARRADRSVAALAARYFRDPRVRIAFGFHPLFIGGHPYRATALYALVSHIERAYGVHFAMGGTAALVAGLVKLIALQGGRVRLGAEVRRIRVEGRRAVGVELADGETLAAPVIVSNADSAYTYGTLLKGHPRRRWTDGRLAKARYSMSLFVWYFGTDRTYPTVDHHTILLGARYKPLLDDIFNARALPDDFSLYLYRPTATDPSLAPPGGDAFYVLSPVPHLDAGVDWAAMAEPYRRRIEATLAARLLPDLARHVVFSRVMTPLDFRDRLLSPKGAAFGLEPVLLQSAWFRPHNRSEEVDGLYLVGAGTHPGAGVPGVLTSARLLDQLVPHAQAPSPAAR